MMTNFTLFCSETTLLCDLFTLDANGYVAGEPGQEAQLTLAIQATDIPESLVVSAATRVERGHFTFTFSKPSASSNLTAALTYESNIVASFEFAIAFDWGDPQLPAPSCAYIRDNAVFAEAKATGVRWLDIPGVGVVEAYCDQDTQGGGWTLMVTKQTTTSSAWTTTFNSACLKTRNAHCASHIPTGFSFSSVMWRFDVTVNTYTTYDAGNGAFNDFLTGGSSTGSGVSAGSFTAYRLASVVGTPNTVIADFHYNPSNGISEQHGSGGSDQIIDLWTGEDTTNLYSYVEQSALQGRKCIAGECRNERIHMFAQ